MAVYERRGQTNLPRYSTFQNSETQGSLCQPCTLVARRVLNLANVEAEEAQGVFHVEELCLVSCRCFSGAWAILDPAKDGRPLRSDTM